MNKVMKTILTVDDTPVNIDIVKAILSAEYTVKAATSGEMALKIIEADIPDLILLDIIMPDMDGYEVCQRLKTKEATRHIPVIFLTGKTHEEDEAKGLQMGAIDYITKPISPGILSARVRTHLALFDANRTLTEKNYELMEAARMKEDVEHIMRHDLKSPLNAISGFPQLLLMDDNLTDKQREMIKHIETAGLGMLNMIDMSLNILKMEYGTYEPLQENVDVLAVVREAQFEHSGAADRKSIQVAIEVDGRPFGQGDAVQTTSEKAPLHCVLGNLIKNAIEAAPQDGSVTISISTDTPLSITVENDGEVPAAIRDRFFDKFVTLGKVSGTGLGTYSAKLITEALGGSIALDTTTPGRTKICAMLPHGRNQA